MAKVRIAVPDDLVRRARLRAAQDGTSVNAVLRLELERYADNASLDAAWDRFLDVAERTVGG